MWAPAPQEGSKERIAPFYFILCTLCWLRAIAGRQQAGSHHSGERGNQRNSVPFRNFNIRRSSVIFCC